MHTAGKPHTLRQQLQLAIEAQIESVSVQDTVKIPQATEKLKQELARVTSVLARLDHSTRQRILYVMIREMDVLAYQIAVAAADIITQPLRDEARNNRDETILDQAVALFEELVG